MVISPSLVLVKVQVTVSSASRTMLLGSLPSSQAALVSVQPAGTASLTEYVSGERGPLSLGGAASVRLKALP